MLVHLNILGASMKGAPFFVYLRLRSFFFTLYYIWVAMLIMESIKFQSDINKLKKMLEKDQDEKIMSEIRKIRKRYFEETVAVITDSNRFK